MSDDTHETLDIGAGERNPTSGELGELQSLVAEMERAVAAREAALAAIPLSSLVKVRLGRWEAHG